MTCRSERRGSAAPLAPIPPSSRDERRNHERAAPLASQSGARHDVSHAAPAIRCPPRRTESAKRLRSSIEPELHDSGHWHVAGAAPANAPGMASRLRGRVRGLPMERSLQTQAPRSRLAWSARSRIGTLMNDTTGSVTHLTVFRWVSFRRHLARADALNAFVDGSPRSCRISTPGSHCETLKHSGTRASPPGRLIRLPTPPIRFQPVVRRAFGGRSSGASAALTASRLRDISSAMGARRRAQAAERPFRRAFARGSQSPPNRDIRCGRTSGRSWRRDPPDVRHLRVCERMRSRGPFAEAARRRAITQSADDVVLVSLPLHFSYALVAQALSALMIGSRLVIGGPPFALESYRAALATHRVSVSSLTPVLTESLMGHDASVLELPRVVTVGGDALDAESVARLVAARRGRDVYITYGLTQAGPRVATLTAHREPRARFGSVGLPLTGTAVTLGKPRSDGLRELHVTSDTVMKRSIGRIEGRVSIATAHRTIATGDAFEQDADGYLHFQGRLGDFITRRGEKINLAAVRRVASQLPHVIRTKTVVIRGDHGDDFDLELQFDASAPHDNRDTQRLLRRVLARAEMPHTLRIDAGRGTEELHYK